MTIPPTAIYFALGSSQELEYGNARDTLRKHVDREDKGVAICDTLGGRQQTHRVDSTLWFELQDTGSHHHSRGASLLMTSLLKTSTARCKIFGINQRFGEDK